MSITICVDIMVAVAVNYTIRIRNGTTDYMSIKMGCERKCWQIGSKRLQEFANFGHKCLILKSFKILTNCFVVRCKNRN